MSIRTICKVLISLLSINMFIYADETIGEVSNSQISTTNQNVSNNDFKGIKGGSLYITPGIMYASSLIGGEFDIGLNKLMSIDLGLGIVGANGGLSFHVLNKNNIDLTINALADYMPALQSVLPEISFGVRGFFGKSARVGLGGRLGIAIITNNITIGSIRYRAGNPMLSYCIGVPIKIKY